MASITSRSKQVRGPRSEDIEFQGLGITIEWRKGDIKKREGSDDPYDGWEMYADYGFIHNTVSPEEAEELDVYVGPDKESKCAFLFSLMKDDQQTFDEFKVLLGFKDLKAATDLFHMQYGSWRTGPIIETSVKDVAEQASLSALKNDKEKKLQDPTEEQPALIVSVEVNDYGQKSEQPVLVVEV